MDKELLKTKKTELEKRFEETRKKGAELDNQLGIIKEEILKMQGEYRALVDLEKEPVKEEKKGK